MAVTLKNKAPLIVPPGIVRKARLRPSDHDEYTPEQRRAILADARAGLKEIGEGKFYGPFETAAQLRTIVERAIKEEARKPKRKVKQG